MIHSIEMTHSRRMLGVGLLVLPATLMAARLTSAGDHGVVLRVSQTSVQIHPDGSTVATNRPLDAQAYAREHGLLAAPSGTQAPAESICEPGGDNVPPPGDPWPGPPGPGEPPNETATKTTVTYTDGWTLYTQWGRTVTPNGHGGYTDGDWQETGRGFTPPGGHTNDDCDIEPD